MSPDDTTTAICFLPNWLPRTPNYYLIHHENVVYHLVIIIIICK
jgi:hypothetical protein